MVLERLRFEPIGWSKAFEFSETDRFCAMDAMDEWLDRLALSRSNVDPNDIPWDALHKMLVQYVYGGRIDNLFDTARLTSFVENLFSAEAYNAQFALSSRCIEVSPSTPIAVGRLGHAVPTVAGRTLPREMVCRVVALAAGRVQVVFLQKYVVVGARRVALTAEAHWMAADAVRVSEFAMAPAIVIPERSKLADIREWVSGLDDTVASAPAMIGLPPRAEMIILATRAERMCIELAKLQDTQSSAMSELTEVLSSTDSEASVDVVPQWMADLQSAAVKWTEMLPPSIPGLAETAKSITNPLFRFMRREHLIAQSVLQLMRTQLATLVRFVDGEVKATNALRQVVAQLAKDAIPPRWSQYAVAQLAVTYWTQDFVRRVAQVAMIAETDYVKSPYADVLWLGGMFSPAGFVAATRQYVAQQRAWSMEDMVLTLSMNEDTPMDDCFLFSGLTLFGAGFDERRQCLVLTEKTHTPLAVSRFRWLHAESKEECEEEGAVADTVPLFVPCYLNKSFKQLLFNVRVPVLAALPTETWVQLSVSFAVWAQ